MSFLSKFLGTDKVARQSRALKRTLARIDHKDEVLRHQLENGAPASEKRQMQILLKVHAVQRRKAETALSRLAQA